MRISDWSSDVCSSDLIVVRHCIRTVAAVLRRVALGIGPELLQVFGAGELPFGASPLGAEVGLAFDRFAIGLVGDHVIAVDGEMVERGGVDRRGCLRCDAAAKNGEAEATPAQDRKSTRLNSSH